MANYIDTMRNKEKQLPQPHKCLIDIEALDYNPKTGVFTWKI